MTLHLYIPHWLLWFSGGIGVGVFVDRLVVNCLLSQAIGRAFGWR